MLSKCLKSALVVAKHETHFINLSPFPAPPVHASLSRSPSLSVSGFFLSGVVRYSLLCVPERMISSEIIIIEGKARRLTKKRRRRGEQEKSGRNEIYVG